MKAMILAAGYGTRLRPLTLVRPKPLFPVLNRPLLSIIIEQLKLAGATEIVINAHYLANQITTFLARNSPADLTTHILVESDILGTGGGLKNAGRFLEDAPFLVINGDIFTTVDVKRAYEFHVASGNTVTMVLHDCPTYNNVQTDGHDAVQGFSRQRNGQMAFTGIHVVNPEVLSLIPEDGYYDILDAYRTLIARGTKVGAYTVTGHYWTDIGTMEAYLALHGDLLQGKATPLPGLGVCDSPFCLGDGVSLGNDVLFADWVCIGDGVHVESNVRLARAVVWDGARVPAGSAIADTVICGPSPTN